MAPRYDSSRVTVVDHPLVQHKLSILRDKNTPTKDFRELVRELAIIEGCEALRDLPLEDVEIETPLEKMVAKRIAGKKLAIIPILRAGLGMVEGILTLVPTARVAHIGLERDEVTHAPRFYYKKFPPAIEERTCLIVDPMLATGGSLIAAIQLLREAGVRDLRALTLVSCPEGIKAVLESDPDVRLYTCSVDRELNGNAYILPGLGDSGDRIFGTLGSL